MRIGIGVSEDLPIPVQQRLAVDVEHAGFASLWTNEARGRDALLLCQAWALATTDLEVGVGVVPLWTRSPAQLAMSAATLQETSGGRFLLGIGVSHPATMEPWHGAKFRRPRTAAREMLEILAELDTHGRADHVGEVLRAERFRLEIAPRPPVTRRYLAAMGPRMLDLAGSHADGVLLNWSDPEETARAAARVRQSAVVAGRDEAAVDVAGYVRIAVADDRDVARAALAQQIAAYARLEAYAAHFARQGHGEAIERVRTAWHARAGEEELAAALGDQALDALGWAGTPADDPSTALDRWARAGLDHLIARVVIATDDPLSSIHAVVRTVPCRS